MANQTQAELFARLQAAWFNPYAQGVSQADAELYAKLSAAVSTTNGQAFHNQTLAEEYAALSAALPLVLDQLSALPAIAYSLRRRTQTYAGPAINVRRDSDNAAMDIGFIGNILDTVTLLAFCGSGNGFVTKWYNQGILGASAAVYQATAVSQPQIVSSGDVVTLNGLPTVYFSGSTYLTAADPGGLPYGSSSCYLNSVASVTTLSNGRTFAYGADAANQLRCIGPYASGWGMLELGPPGAGSPNISCATGTISVNVPYIMGGEVTSSYIKLLINSANGTLTLSTAPATTQGLITVGANVSLNRFHVGSVSECVLLSEVSSVDEAILTSNQKVIYGTP